MKIEAKNAGIASSKSVQLMSLKEANIIIPTKINAGAVACAGTIAISGEKDYLGQIELLPLPMSNLFDHPHRFLFALST